MIDNNHLSSVPCYNGTMLTNEYYNGFFDLGQQKINFYFYELCLPDDDPVYTLKKVMEDLDFSGLLAIFNFCLKLIQNFPNISIDTNRFLFYFIRRICLSIVQADINSSLPFMRHAPKAVFYYCWRIESDCCL